MARHLSTGPGARRTPAPVLCLVRSWATGIVVLSFTEYVQVTAVYDPLVGPGGVHSFGAALALVHLPNLLCLILATWAAARVHPLPWRASPLRHATAACAVPVAAQLLTLALGRGRTGPETQAFWMSTGVLLAACAVGLLLDTWWEGRE
jgi:hypothetical protein